MHDISDIQAKSNRKISGWNQLSFHRRLCNMWWPWDGGVSGEEVVVWLELTPTPHILVAFSFGRWKQNYRNCGLALPGVRKLVFHSPAAHAASSAHCPNKDIVHGDGDLRLSRVYSISLVSVQCPCPLWGSAQCLCLKSVKCYPGGWKIDLMSSISEVRSQFWYHCIQYIKRHHVSLFSHF